MHTRSTRHVLLGIERGLRTAAHYAQQHHIHDSAQLVQGERPHKLLAMVRRVNSSRAVATGSGGFTFRAFAGTLVVLCVLACAALILRFSASTSAQGPDDNAREDPTAGKHTSMRFRPGGAGAAVRRGGRRNAEQGGGARAGPQVAEETGKLSQELAAEKSTGPGGAASGARGGDGWDVEEVPVTRRRIPIPDDADLMTSAAAPGNGSEPVVRSPCHSPSAAC